MPRFYWFFPTTGRDKGHNPSRKKTKNWKACKLEGVGRPLSWHETKSNPQLEKSQNLYITENPQQLPILIFVGLQVPLFGGTVCVGGLVVVSGPHRIPLWTVDTPSIPQIRWGNLKWQATGILKVYGADPRTQGTLDSQNEEPPSLWMVRGSPPSKSPLGFYEPKCPGDIYHYIAIRTTNNKFHP